MWILLMTITAVILNDGTLAQVTPPRTAVIETYATLKECEDARVEVTQGMVQVYRQEAEQGTFMLECQQVKRLQ